LQVFDNLIWAIKISKIITLLLARLCCAALWRSTALEASGGLHQLRVGWLRRQWRKATVLLRAAWAGFAKRPLH
jgi:hypothetical protein